MLTNYETYRKQHFARRPRTALGAGLVSPDEQDGLASKPSLERVLERIQARLGPRGFYIASILVVIPILAMLSGIYYIISSSI